MSRSGELSTTQTGVSCKGHTCTRTKAFMCATAMVTAGCFDHDTCDTILPISYRFTNVMLFGFVAVGRAQSTIQLIATPPRIVASPSSTLTLVIMSSCKKRPVASLQSNSFRTSQRIQWGLQDAKSSILGDRSLTLSAAALLGQHKHIKHRTRKPCSSRPVYQHPSPKPRPDCH